MTNTPSAVKPYDAGKQDPGPRKAGAFDIRNVIGALIGFYGIVLILVGLFDDTAAQLAKTGDLNANLWSGIVMAVGGAGFVVWSRVRPVIVESYQQPDDDQPPH